jgi:hypothetical protein
MAMIPVTGVKIGLAGFAIAAIGAAVGFAGFQIDEKALALVGLAVVVVGVVIGCAGIVYGWITEGKRAIKGSIQFAKDLGGG